MRTLIAACAFCSLVLAQPAPTRVELRGNEVWLVCGAVEREITRDGKTKLPPALNPSGDRIAYAEACPESEHCLPQVILLDLAGRRLLAFRPSLAIAGNGPCASVLALQWNGDNRLGVECHVNPSLSEYIETRLITRATVRDLLGFGFVPAPDHHAVAHVGWIVHFAPPFAQSYYLQLDDLTVYPLPAGLRPVRQKWPYDPLPVVQHDGAVYRGIHEFVSHLAWSPDSRRVGLIDCIFDWTPNHPAALDNDGVSSSPTCFAVAVEATGAFERFPLSGVPRGAAVSWPGPARLAVDAPGLHLEWTLPALTAQPPR